MPMQPDPKTIGHGNAQFLCDLQQPGITKSELRNRAKAGAYPDLWKGAGQWIELQGVK